MERAGQKNRRKDGGYYWVVAHVTPVTEGGQIVGYMSVRTKPTRQQIHAAIAAYAELNKGSQSTMTLAQGRVVRKSALAALLGAAASPCAYASHWHRCHR